MGTAEFGGSGSNGAPACMIGVGASAGGVEALMHLVRELPARLDAALFVVLHVSPSGTSVLADILDRAGPLPAVPATDGAPVESGVVYVAPPDRHLLVRDGIIELSAGPRENGHRPAVDPTFRSLAQFDGHAIGVILSGTRDDGTVGLARIKAHGGTALVQDPQEAAYGGMIDSAIRHVEVDAVLPVANIAHHLVVLTRTLSAMTDDPPPDDPPATTEEAGSTRYTCPECGGHISRVEEEGALVRYLCEVGHAYSPDSLEEDQGMAVEAALWTATRMLGDRCALLGEMADRAEQRGHGSSALGFRERAEAARRAAHTIRGLLEAGSIPTSSAEVGE